MKPQKKVETEIKNIIIFTLIMLGVYLLAIQIF